MEHFKKFQKAGVLFLFLLFWNGAYTQNPPKFYKNAISFTPTTLYNISGKPGLEFEYERFLNPKVSLFTEYTYVQDFTETYTFMDGSDFFNGHTLTLGSRYYFKTIFERILGHEIKSQFYVDAAIHIGKTHRGMTSTFINVDSMEYEDKYVSNRFELGGLADFGFRTDLGRFFLDYKLGFGAMKRQVSHTERDQISDTFNLPDGEYWLFEYEPEGRYRFFYPRMKFAFGFRF